VRIRRCVGGHTRVRCGASVQAMVHVPSVDNRVAVLLRAPQQPFPLRMCSAHAPLAPRRLLRKLAAGKGVVTCRAGADPDEEGDASKPQPLRRVIRTTPHSRARPAAGVGVGAAHRSPAGDDRARNGGGERSRDGDVAWRPPPMSFAQALLAYGDGGDAGGYKGGVYAALIRGHAQRGAWEALPALFRSAREQARPTVDPRTVYAALADAGEHDWAQCLQVGQPRPTSSTALPLRASLHCKPCTPLLGFGATRRRCCDAHAPTRVRRS
jgi:hypothetical protein